MRLPRALAALVAVFLVAGCGSTAAGAPSDAPLSGTSSSGTSSASAPAPTAGDPSSASSVPSGPAPIPRAAAVSVSSVTIDAIGVRTTRLEKLATDADGVLEAPRDPDRAGWFAGGTVPGQTGPAVIAGHVDSTTGPAVFFDLRRVSKGDVIKVGLSDGTTARFVADRVVTTPKDGFPTDAVFGSTPDAELRLITCGGPYDRTVGSYVDNTIVFASAA